MRMWIFVLAFMVIGIGCAEEAQVDPCNKYELHNAESSFFSWYGLMTNKSVALEDAKCFMPGHLDKEQWLNSLRMADESGELREIYYKEGVKLAPRVMNIECEQNNLSVVYNNDLQGKTTLCKVYVNLLDQEGNPSTDEPIDFPFVQEGDKFMFRFY